MQTSHANSEPRISLLASDEQKLRAWLESHPSGHERAAFVLFRRLDRWRGPLRASPRYVAIEVIPATDDWVIDSSPTYVSFSKQKLQPLYHRCERERLVLGFVHNHPIGPDDFSGKDDENEAQLVHRLAQINSPDSELVALLLHDGRWQGRVRSGIAPDLPARARHVGVIGDRLDVHVRHGAVSGEEDVLARQEAAFGKPFTAKMASLRFVVVGAGGTGSPTATLLARAGAGEIVIIDHDKLETTNLNRVRGARREDVGERKAIVLANYINGLGLRTRAVAIHERLQTAEAMDALSSADLVFGCTDSETSRDVMNTAVHVYGQALIDMGLGGSIDIDTAGIPSLRTHSGRVNLMTPEFGRCLYCHKVITEAGIRYEEAIEANPELKNLSADELRQRYLRNTGGEQAPGVAPFTSATADFAVMTLFDLIKPFRKLPEDVLRDCVRIDFVGMQVFSNRPADTLDCAFCQERRFRLLDERGTRLRRPQLGALQCP